jgi:hypothetical protein
MFSRRLNWLPSAALLLTVTLQGDEENFWPIYVRRDVEGGNATVSQWLGPLIFSQSGPGSSYGFRPLFQETHSGGVEQGNALYPLFTWRKEDDYRTFSFFQLVNSSTDTPPSAPGEHRFDIWPFYFSREAVDPADSYRAFFPLGGTIKNRFGKDRINFVLFPLYARTEKSGKNTLHTPWPFLRSISGEGNHGFEFWPLFGRSGRPDDYDRQFYLWPLIYKSVANLEEETPDIKVGVLPFYSRDTGPGYISETYAWPFFGYAHRTIPYRYNEQRYFWPLLVQGEGDERLVNRWAPFYTHSIIKGSEKTWFLWPLFRDQRWEADGVAQRKDQFLFFLYWSLRQQSLTNPAAAPAHKTHLWPFYSAWNNGDGRKQVQALSPFEVFFPGNETVRQLWSPLFAVYRYDRYPGATARHSLLWNAVTYRRSPVAKEFHLGPLFSVHANAAQRRVALGNGVIGLRSDARGRWRPFLFDFRPKRATLPANQATPP